MKNRLQASWLAACASNPALVQRLRTLAAGQGGEPEASMSAGGAADEVAEEPAPPSADRLDELQAMLFGDLDFWSLTATVPAATDDIPLPRHVDLWLSREPAALAAALRLLRLDVAVLPDRTPLAVIRGRRGEVFRAQIPAARWPTRALAQREPLKDAVIASREGGTGTDLLIGASDHPCLPHDTMVVVWPLLAGLGPEAFPPELFSRQVRRTTWLEPPVGRIAAADLQAALSRGMPGRAVRIAVFGAVAASRQAVKSDRTPPLKALELQLNRLGDVTPRPWVVLAP